MIAEVSQESLEKKLQCARVFKPSACIIFTNVHCLKASPLIRLSVGEAHQRECKEDKFC